MDEQLKEHRWAVDRYDTLYDEYRNMEHWSIIQGTCDAADDWPEPLFDHCSGVFGTWLSHIMYSASHEFFQLVDLERMLNEARPVVPSLRHLDVFSSRMVAIGGFSWGLVYRFVSFVCQFMLRASFVGFIHKTSRLIDPHIDNNGEVVLPLPGVSILVMAYNDIG